MRPAPWSASSRRRAGRSRPSLPRPVSARARLRAFTTMSETAVSSIWLPANRRFAPPCATCAKRCAGRPGARLSFASAYARAAERGERAAALAVWLTRYLEGTDVTIVVDSVDRWATRRAFSEFVEVLAGRGAFAPRLVVAARDTSDLPVPRWLAADLIAMPVGEATCAGPSPTRAPPPTASGSTRTTACSSTAGAEQRRIRRALRAAGRRCKRMLMR